VRYDERVVRQDAAQAVRRRRPTVVICSWPPEGNQFEREIFKVASVEVYIVIGSQHEFGAGNVAAYLSQRQFDCAIEPRLSVLVLPPELDPAVYIFRRRTEVPADVNEDE
jgi:hypothetical protein